MLGQRLQQRQLKNKPSIPNNWNEAQRNKALDTARAIKRACRWLPFNTTCLAQSMAAQSMLNRRGVSCIIHFGVRKSEADLNFHAWVLHEDLMVTGGDVSDYQVFKSD
ncbi:MAG: lasso peptide biosynthesis B2 protein [Desulfamplus sp.]|nr:lasso peptide biosynthesis B2 protein [Desulfamplus sp.]